MSDNIFADTAPRYFAQGLSVIPLYSREKRPVPMEWSQYHDTPVPEQVQADWLQSCSTGNIGLVLGKQSGICVLDIDTENEGLIQLIRDLLPPSPWVRIGQKGMVLAFKYTGHKTFRIKTASGESLCELLSERTQVVLPPSIHPKTGMPYKANCDLLSVLDKLPVLDPQIEEILRGALQTEGGVQLSISGSSRVTDFVSSGARDISLTEKAGLFAYAVMRGERTVKEAVGMLRSYNTEFVEAVAGDGVDVEKHVDNLIRFLHRDVHEKRKPLPEGWDADMTEEEKRELGLNFSKDDEEWSYDEMIDFLQDEFTRHPEQSRGRAAAVDQILERVARSSNLSSLDEGRLVQYIADVGAIGARAPLLKQRIRELRSNGITGSDHNEIAQAVLEDLTQLNEIRRYGAGLWRYMGSHWEEMPQETIMARISQEYGHLQAGKKHSDHKGIYATILNLADTGIKTSEKRGVNFANGFLDEDLVLHDHSPDFGMVYTLPFRYLPEEAGNSPHFFQFLHDSWGHDEDFYDKVDALQEALSVTLFGLGPRYQRVVLCQGVAKSGKSQMLTIAQSLVPEEAKCFVPPNEWGDKFMPTMMHEKLINVCGELSEKKKIDGQRFKDIVDGAEMSGQQKGQQIFKFRPNCTHWFASNHTPKTDDTSEGFNRRWLILEFNKPVDPSKRRVDLGNIIVSEERESIVAWAVLGLARLVRNSEYTLPMSHKQLLREVAQENNSVRFFMEESPAIRIVRDSCPNHSSRTLENKLYKEYWSFCFGPGGAKPVGLRAFRQQMREMQSEMKFNLVIETNAMGGQETYYDLITLVNEKTS